MKHVCSRSVLCLFLALATELAQGDALEEVVQAVKAAFVSGEAGIKIFG